jgi:hypothetical protein
MGAFSARSPQGFFAAGGEGERAALHARWKNTAKFDGRSRDFSATLWVLPP